MLNDASKYECLDVTGLEGFITGGIMPKRDTNGDGSWRAMKYEDLLFLKEAYLERGAAARNGIGEKATPPKRGLAGTAFYNAATFPSTVTPLPSTGATELHGTYYLDPEANISLQGRDAGSEDLAQALALNGLALEDGSAAISPKGRLDSDAVRKAFHRLKKYSRTFRVPTGTMGTVTRTTTYVTAEGETSSGDPVTEDFGYDGVLLYSTGYASRVGSSNVRCSFTYNTPEQYLWMYNVSWMYLVKGEQTYKGGGTESKTKLFRRVSGNGYVAKPNLGLLLPYVASSFGFSYNPSPHYSENISTSYWMLAAGLVIDHRFPSYFGDLGWSWEPSA